MHDFTWLGVTNREMSILWINMLTITLRGLPVTCTTAGAAWVVHMR